MRRILVPAYIALLAVPASVEAQEADPAALPEGPGRETVLTFCSSCHSLRLVTRQRLTRERWDALLGWMAETQNMPVPDTATRAEILDYLSAHFSAAPSGGRTRRR